MSGQPSRQALHHFLLVAGVGRHLQPGRCAAASQQQQREHGGQALGQAQALDHAASPAWRRTCSRAPDGEDAARLGRVVLDLGAQPVDVRVDGVLVTLVLVAPDLIQQVQPRIDLVGMAGEEMQQVELARRQVQRAPSRSAVRATGSMARPCSSSVPASMRALRASASLRRSSARTSPPAPASRRAWPGSRRRPAPGPGCGAPRWNGRW